MFGSPQKALTSSWKPLKSQLFNTSLCVFVSSEDEHNEEADAPCFVGQRSGRVIRPINRCKKTQICHLKYIVFSLLVVNYRRIYRCVCCNTVETWNHLGLLELNWLVSFFSCCKSLKSLQIAAFSPVTGMSGDWDHLKQTTFSGSRRFHSAVLRVCVCVCSL